MEQRNQVMLSFQKYVFQQSHTTSTLCYPSAIPRYYQLENSQGGFLALWKPLAAVMAAP